MRDNRSLCPFLALLLLASAGSAANTGAKTAAVSSAKALVHSLASGDDKTPTAKFTTKMKQGPSPRKLKQAWRQVTANAGQFKGTGAIKTVPYHGDTVVFVKVPSKDAGNAMLIPAYISCELSCDFVMPTENVNRR